MAAAAKRCGPGVCPRKAATTTASTPGTLPRHPHLPPRVWQHQWQPLDDIRMAQGRPSAVSCKHATWKQPNPPWRCAPRAGVVQVWSWYPSDGPRHSRPSDRGRSLGADHRSYPNNARCSTTPMTPLRCQAPVLMGTIGCNIQFPGAWCNPMTPWQSFARGPARSHRLCHPGSQRWHNPITPWQSFAGVPSGTIGDP